MLIAKIAVNGVHATSTKLGTLTSGMVGAKVQFSFNSSWDGLSKTAVFRCMDITKDVLNIDSEVTIPHEVLVRSGSPLYAGVYGANADGDLVIPTRWATVGIVYSGADPSGDPSAELTPGAVDQMMIILSETKKAAEDAHQKAADAVKPYTLRAEDAAAASGQFANASNMSAESAGKHEANARASENNAKNSAQSAEQSARNALSSEQNALNSAKNAATSEQNADQSSKAAATSEQNVAAAAAAAAKSAKNAKASEDNSKATWAFAKDEAAAAKAARKAAEDAAADASVSKNATLQAAEQVSKDAQSAKNSAARADQVLDAALSVQAATVGQFLIVEEVDENGKPIRWKGVDRTHWVEQGMVEVLAETTVALSDDGEANIEPFTLAGGDTYIVKWNGVEYECIAQDLSAMVGSEAYSLGNHKAMGMEDTGEPFIITSMPSHGTGMIGAFDGSATLTISIYQESEVVHHLDPKYIKDMYYTEGGLVEILPETTLTTTENNLGEFYIEENPPVLVAGNTYIVNWNGTEYTCTAQDLTALMAGAVGLGDMYTFTDGAFGTAATGEPYVLIYAPGMGFSAQAIKATEELSLTLSIHQSGEIGHKIPNKYLDLDWLPTKTEGDEVFLPETTITFENGVCYMQALGAFVPGDKYTIVLDGEKHSFVAIEDTETDTAFQYVGNRGLGGGEDTGEPYYFCTMQNDDGYVMSLMVADKFSGDKTVAISHFNQTYNKLPEAYLPDSVESVIIRSSTAGSTKKFKLSVDDSGTITATEVT